MVVLDKDIREDDAEQTMLAILHIKGVISVAANVTDAGGMVARTRAKADLRDKLWKVLEGE